MRPKLRAWDKINKRYVSYDNGDYPYMLIDLDGNVAFAEDGQLEVDFLSDGDTAEENHKRQMAGLTNRFILELSTGQKGLNGKEVWVGSIVEFFSPAFKQKLRREVVYDNELGQYGVYILKDEIFFVPKDSKVIGNVHQHPELLKNPKKVP